MSQNQTQNNEELWEKMIRLDKEMRELKDELKRQLEECKKTISVLSDMLRDDLK